MSLSDLRENFSVQAPAFIQDPYPIYQWLRDNDPVHYSEDGYFFLTRYADVAAALTDRRLRNSPAPFSPLNERNAHRFLAADVANRLITFMDPPSHVFPRRIFSSCFQSRVNESRSKIEQFAKDAANLLRAQNVADFVEQFSAPFATRCIAYLIGIDENYSDRLRYWSDMFFYLFHSIQNEEILSKLNSTISEFRDVIRSHLQYRKKNPSEDLLSKLLSAEVRGQSITDDQIVDNLMLICSDAIGNVHTGLTTAVATLLRHNDQRRRLLGHPERVASTVQECIRYESPAQYQGRIAGEEFEIGGKRIRKNSVVLIALGSANRDPNFIKDPDRFDIGRPKSPNVAFGLGIHRCLGFGLVALEFEAVLSTLFNQDLGLTLVDDKLDWIVRAGHRWPKSLKVEFR